jgi:DNA-binding NarL/FixJ family response regulator
MPAYPSGWGGDPTRHAAQNALNAQIAERLTVTETTVESHINHLYGKTGAHDRAQAVAYAYRHGLAPGSQNP